MLEIKKLSTSFFTKRGIVKAVDNLSLTVKKGEIIGFVGESGCGKSVTLFSLLRLVSYPGRITGGEVWFENEDLLKKTSREMRSIRGNKISMIFQDPMSSLNPAFFVGDQILETISIHSAEKSSRRQKKERVLELIDSVGLPSPEQIYTQYPHQLSGGMQQRILIAIALSCNSRLLLADEPTTALDVTVQAQVLDLLVDINKKRGTSIIFVTHDLGVVAEFCQRVAVMYAGRIVESGNVDDITLNPKHPYTQALINSIPKISVPRERIHPIPGDVPDLAGLDAGCAFAPRCQYSMPECRKESIPWTEVSGNWGVRCLRNEK